MQLTPEQINLLGLPKGSIVTLSIEPPKPEKWEPKHIGNGYSVSSNLNVIANCNNSYTPAINLFPSPMSAGNACNNITSYLRQLAWLRENDDGWFAEWDNTNQLKYQVTYNHREKAWVRLYTTGLQDIAGVYMSKSNADKLLDLLNSGIVEF
jgi:hypothetical protein